MQSRLEKSAIVVSILLTVMATGTTSAKLVAHWKLDEMSGKTVKDSSGNGHHGTVVEGTPIWDSDGKYGGSLNFDETYGVSIPSDVFSSINEAITVSVWVKGDPDQGRLRNVILQAGADVGRAHHFTVSIYTDWQAGQIKFETGSGGENESEAWPNVKLEDWAGRWNHYAFVADCTENLQKIYHNGELVKEGTGDTPMAGTTKANIGLATDRIHDQYVGKLDDICIYDHALTKEEIGRLYWLGPGLLQLGQGVWEMGAPLNERGSQEAIASLESKVAEVEHWGREKPGEYASVLKELLFDLNFLLAKAKQAAGVANKDVEAAYRRASEQGVPSPWCCPSVLLWLQENGKEAEHSRIACSVNQEYLDTVITEANAKAKLMVSQNRPQEAVNFLQATLAACTIWKNNHSRDVTPAPERLPDLYLHLAKAREAAGAPQNDIAKAYGGAFAPVMLSSVQARADALIWLVNNGSTEDCTQAVKSFSRRSEVHDSVIKIVGTLCSDLESKKDWAKFERFLDTVFSQASNPAAWVTIVESCLSDRKNRWAKGYLRYVDSKPELKFARDCALAQKHLSDEKFLEAAELYRQIVNSCDSEDDKAFYQFQLCKSLFHGSPPADVLQQLDSFITNYSASHPALARGAALMKGRLYLQSRRLDEALAQFRSAAADFAGTPQACEARFFAAYCSMLQGGLDSATEALNAVEKDCPESQWARKAHLCLTGIENEPADEAAAN